MFQNAGVVVMTDGFLHEARPQCKNVIFCSVFNCLLAEVDY